MFKNKLQRRRFFLLLFMLVALGAASILVLSALNKNINFFVSPSELQKQTPSLEHGLRLGGIVKKGSVQYNQAKTEVSFVVTDYAHEITVRYHGLLPDLFSEGRDVVANGHLTTPKEFVADEVLAKHDSTYMPANVRDAIERAKKQKSMP